MADEDLRDCYEKWKNREISEYSWVVPGKEIEKSDYDLTARNPNRKADFKHLPPETILSGIIDKEKKIAEILEEL